MSVTQEVQNWIEEMKSAGASEDWIKSTLGMAEANEVFQKGLRGSVLATKDYTKAVQEAKAEAERAKQEFQKTTEWYSTLVDWKGQEDKKTAEALKQREEAERKLAQANSVLEVLKTQGYVDDATLSGLGQGARRDSEPAVDMSKFIRADEFNKRAGAFAKNTALLAAQVHQLASEHDRIFNGVDGQMFDGESLINLIDENPGKFKSLREAWESKYPVASRRQEIDNKQREEEISRRAEELYRKRVSADAAAGRPVNVNPTLGNMGKISGLNPSFEKSPQQRRLERLNKAFASSAASG